MRILSFYSIMTFVFIVGFMLFWCFFSVGGFYFCLGILDFILDLIFRIRLGEFLGERVFRVLIYIFMDYCNFLCRGWGSSFFLF